MFQDLHQNKVDVKASSAFYFICRPGGESFLVKETWQKEESLIFTSSTPQLSKEAVKLTDPVNYPYVF
jgi:hypothetical protein